MAIQTGDRVRFFYTNDTDSLPGLNARDDGTIYFDQDAKQIYIGKNSDAIAANNAAQDLSNFVTNTSLASTLSDYVTTTYLTSNYVTKQTPVVQTSLGVANASTGVQTIMTQTTTGFSFSTYDEDLPNDPYGPAVLSNLATPVANTDAATKAYVDANSGPTWTVG